MKYNERWFTLVAVFALFAVSCTGSSEAAAPAITPVAAATPAPTATSIPEPAPTATPDAVEIAVAAQDRVDAAAAALDAAVSAGDGPADLIAYDLIESAVDSDGIVTLTICGWTGETVFDGVFDSLFRTAVDADGTITADHLTTPVASGDCLNTELIESAIATADEYEIYWKDIIADPTRFLEDSRGEVLVSEAFLERSGVFAQSWVEDNLQYKPAWTGSALRQDAVTDVLWRRYRGGEVAQLEFAFCHDMNPEYGAYRNDVLIDKLQSADGGRHAISAFQLVRESGRWKIWNTDALAWSECIELDWPGGASAWRSAPEPFALLP